MMSYLRPCIIRPAQIPPPLSLYVTNRGLCYSFFRKSETMPRSFPHFATKAVGQFPKSGDAARLRPGHGGRAPISDRRAST